MALVGGGRLGGLRTGAASDPAATATDPGSSSAVHHHRQERRFGALVILKDFFRQLAQYVAEGLLDAVQWGAIVDTLMAGSRQRFEPEQRGILLDELHRLQASCSIDHKLPDRDLPAAVLPAAAAPEGEAAAAGVALSQLSAGERAAVEQLHGLGFALGDAAAAASASEGDVMDALGRLFRQHGFATTTLGLSDERDATGGDGKQQRAEEAETLAAILEPSSLEVGSTSTLMHVPAQLREQLGVERCALEAFFVAPDAYPTVTPLFAVICPAMDSATKLDLMAAVNALAVEQAGDCCLFEAFDALCVSLTERVEQLQTGPGAAPPAPAPAPDAGSGEPRQGLQRSLSVRATKKLSAGLLKLLDSLLRKRIINQATSAHLKDIALEGTSSFEATEGEDLLAEVRRLSFLYGEDVRARPTTFEEKVDGFTHIIMVHCLSSSSSSAPTATATTSSPEPTSVELVLRIPELYPLQPPDVSLGAVGGGVLSTGDLIVLERLLQDKVAATAGALGGARCNMLHPLVTEVVAFLTAVDEQAPKEPAQIRGIPRDPTVVQLRNASCQLDSGSLDELLTRMQRAVEAKLKATKEFHAVDMEVVVSRHVLAGFLATLNAETADVQGLGAVHAPTIAFHGSMRLEAVNSIAADGLVAAGDHTAGGSLVPMAHGELYGDGIYVSPDVSTADGYAFGDSRGHSQVFATLVLLGRSKRLTQEDLRRDPQAVRNDRIDFDSRVSPNGGIYILHEQRRVLPCLLVTYRRVGQELLPPQQASGAQAARPIAKHKTKWTDLKRRLKEQEDEDEQDEDEVGGEGEGEEGEGAAAQQRHAKNTKKKKGQPNLRVVRLPTKAPLWLVPLNATFLRKFPSAAPLPSALHMVYLVDRSNSLGVSFERLVLPACGRIAQAVKADRSDAVFFGKTLHHEAQVTAQFFESARARAIGLEPATNLGAALEQGVNLVLRRWEECKDSEEAALLHQVQHEYDECLRAADKAAQRRAKEEELASHGPSNRRRKADRGKGAEPEEEQTPEQEAEKQLRRERELRRCLEQAKASRSTAHVFNIVLLTDGSDTVNSPAQLDAILDQTFKKMHGSGIQCNFQLFAIGKETDTTFGMKAKVACQTINATERHAVFYARKVRQIPEATRQLVEQLEQLSATSNLHISVPGDATKFDEGFVTQTTMPPQRTVHQHMGQDNTAALLFKGLPPRHLWVGYTRVPIRLDAKGVALERLPVQSAVLAMATGLIADLKVAAVAQRDVEPAVALLRGLVATIKAATLSADALAKLAPPTRLRWMKTKTRLVIELETEFNDVLDTVLAARNEMSNDEKALWLVRASSMKYGNLALRRAGLHTAALITDELRDLDLSAVASAAADPVSRLSRNTAAAHLLELRQLPANNLMTLTDLLYAFGCVGPAIRVRPTDSAVISPWNVQVEYVSTMWGDTASAMCALHANLEVRDARAQRVQDMLVIVDPRNPAPYKLFWRTKLFDAYTAVVFSRNPGLYLPAQHIALLGVALVRAVTQLLQGEHQTPALLGIVFNTIYTIRWRVGRRREPWDKALADLLSPTPGKHMTEADGDNIASVCQILTAICCFPDSPSLARLFADRAQLARAAVALMAESVSREARVKIRTSSARKARARAQATEAEGRPAGVTDQEVSFLLLAKVLNITPESCVAVTADDQPEPTAVTHSDSYDRATAKKKSGGFFAHSWTNCPPQAVMACITFGAQLAGFDFGAHTLEGYLEAPAEEAAEGAEGRVSPLHTHILDAFRDVTMAKFVTEYAQVVAAEEAQWDATDLQIALYVQALRYYNSKARRHGVPPLDNPVTVAREAARSSRAFLYVQQARAKAQRRRLERLSYEKNARRYRLLAEQDEFMITHGGLPRVFSQQEVLELNEDRPLSDQLELTDSGMLRHHCAFPACNYFLASFATEADRVCGTRRGLFGHLNPLLVPRQMYIPGLHKTAVALAPRYRASRNKKAFVSDLLDRLEGRTGTDMARKEVAALAQGVFDSFIPPA